MGNFMRNIRDIILGRILCCRRFDESELHRAYTIGYEKGYAQCKKDYGIEAVSKQAVSHRSVSKTQPKIDKVVLFIKADRGNMILDDIRRENHLSENMSEELYEAQYICGWSRENGTVCSA